MKKHKIVYSCQECAYETPKWIGKCPECKQWNSFIEEASTKSSSSNKIAQKDKLKTLIDIRDEHRQRIHTGIDEFDRVVGGGITVGSLCLVGGEPGVGKSTLLLEVCQKLSLRYKSEKVIYVSAEESGGQIAGRARRLGIKSKNILLMNDNNVQNILKVAKKEKPIFLVLDSIQTLYSSEVQSVAGSLSQVREVTFDVMNFCKEYNITCLIIGHVTKDGQIAGPKLLEHMVDTVVYFEGDDLNNYRILRAIKNRFGNTNELGIFEMSETGLQEVENPSHCFIETTDNKSFGKSVSCILEGSRPLFVEVQSLVVENKFGSGRRTTQGIDSSRLSLLIAVIDKYFEVPLSINDIYANVVGGLKLTTRETDLSVIAALLSSFHEQPLPNDVIFIGEVGLTGEVRSVPKTESRLKEVEKMNFRQVITSTKAANEYRDKYSIEIFGINQAVEIRPLLFL